MLHAGKRVENRAWNITARGPFLIHVGKGWDDEAPLYIHRVNFPREIPDPLWSELPRGAIVGRATILDCLPVGSPDDANLRQICARLDDYQRAWPDDVVATLDFMGASTA